MTKRKVSESMVVEVRERWDKFVAAFNALGAETRGMTPTAASLLLVTAAEYENDNSKGYYKRACNSFCCNSLYYGLFRIIFGKRKR